MNERVMENFAVTAADLIGHGGESWVYALPDAKVLRLYKNQTVKREYLERLAAFYHGIHGKFSFETPLFLEIGEEDGSLYSVSKRIPGEQMAKMLPTYTSAEKLIVYRNYFEAVEEIKSVSFPEREYGQILPVDALTAPTWTAFLETSLRKQVREETGKYLERDVDDFQTTLERVIADIAQFEPHAPKYLVHGDFFPNNILIDKDLNITGVLDMSGLTVVGDPIMDVAGCYVFLETADGATAEDQEILLPIIVAKYGESIHKAIAFYRVYYAIYFGFKEAPDAVTYPQLYSWCVQALKNYKKTVTA